MQIVIRLILACLLLVQSVPGLALVRCTGMAGVLAQGAPVACPCCAGDDDDDDSDSTATGGACATVSTGASCCCGQPQRDGPAVPTADLKVEDFQQLLVAMPVLIGLLAPEAKPVATAWVCADASSHPSGNSIQSILCVWVM